MIQFFPRSRFFNLPLLAVLLACFATPAWSVTDTAEQPRLAIVDIQRILLHSKVGKEARKSFEKEFKGKQAIIDRKTGQYEKLEKELTKNLSIMNEKTLKQKSEEIENKKKELVRAKEDFSDELRRKQEELKLKIFKQLQGVLDEFGESQGYSVIFDRDAAGVLYMSEAIDVTESVIDLYDRKY